MSIVFACECGKQFNAKPELAGKQAKCGGCGRVITVPHESPDPLNSPDPLGGGLGLAQKRAQCTFCMLDVLPGVTNCPKCGRPIAGASGETDEQDKGHSLITRIFSRLKKPLWGGCPRCGYRMARRVLPGSISGTSHTPGLGATWSWKKGNVCISCAVVECVVEQCASRADRVVRHEFDVGGGKARSSIPNDLCVCRKHAQMTRIFRLVRFAAIWGLIIGIIAILIAVFNESHPRGAIATASVTTPIGVLSMAGALSIRFIGGLRKKRKYVETVKGEHGSVWKDSGFAA